MSLESEEGKAINCKISFEFVVPNRKWRSDSCFVKPCKGRRTGLKDKIIGSDEKVLLAITRFGGREDSEPELFCTAKCKNSIPI